MAEVWLDAAAHDQLATEAGRRRLLETGGPIFGYTSDSEIVVTEIFGPGPNAAHRPRSFSCSRGWTQDCIQRVFNESGGLWSYLGEWHTHPLGHASPSRKDEEAVSHIANTPGVDLTHPTILIQGTRLFRQRVHMDRLAAYRWEPTDACLIKQNLIVANIATQLQTPE